MTATQVLLYLAPPSELLDSLEQLFIARQQRGGTVADANLAWLHRWQELYADGAVPTDGLPSETWAQVGDMIVGTKKDMEF